jgi:hypothetical protein
MPAYIVHIGPPKAGSKYLQSSLGALSEDLLKDGICYPTRLFAPQRKVWHEGLANRLKSGAGADLERIFSELNGAGYRYVCFSYEGLFALTADQLRYLRGLMAGSEVQIVYYCRRWSERIPSLWKQSVKGGFIETFPEYLARALRSPVDGLDLNPRLVWDRFADIFGRESLRLISFNNLIESQVDLVRHFLDTFLGWPCAKLPEDAFSNESPDIFDCEILRALNAIHRRKTGSTSDEVRIHYLRQRKSLDVGYLLAAMKEDLAETLVSDHFQVFKDIYQQMRAYVDRMASPEYGEELFQPKANRFSYVQQNYLLDGRAALELHRIYEEIRPSQSHGRKEAPSP